MIDLRHGDCLEIMDELISQGVKVDAIITDPPYGTMKGFDYNGKSKDNHSWDTCISPKEIFERSNKILRKNGKLILFSQEPYTSKLITNSIPNIPFSYRLTWLKDNFANHLGVNKAPVNFTEDILIFSKGHCYDAPHPLKYTFASYAEDYGIENLVKLFQKEGRYNTLASAKVHSSYKFGYGKGARFDLMDKKMFDFLSEYIHFHLDYSIYKIIDKEYKERYKSVFNLPEGQKYKSNILEYKKDYKGLHPTQKPVALIEDLIKTYTNEGELVLDFTMGSGTTAIACQNTNRHCIGIELDETYFNIAKERLKNNKL